MLNENLNFLNHSFTTTKTEKIKQEKPFERPKGWSSAENGPTWSCYLAHFCLRTCPKWSKSTKSTMPHGNQELAFYGTISMGHRLIIAHSFHITSLIVGTEAQFYASFFLIHSR